MLFNGILLFTYLAVMCAGGWLFVHRRSYQGWFYLLYAFVFACFALGLFAPLQVLSVVGYIVLLAVVGLHLFTQCLLSVLEVKELDIKAGKDRKVLRLLATDG